MQNYIIEVWIEKSTQNDWLVPLCQRRGVNLCVGIGEQSETRSRELALRSAKYGAPVRVIYISDFDPGGRSMPKAVARKVEFTLAKFDLKADIQLIPLALSQEQCRNYRLPRTPIKDTEKRKDKFEQLFGVGATELDALEALHPGEMGRLLTAEIDNFIDGGLEQRVRRLRLDLETRITQIESQVEKKFSEKIQILEDKFERATNLLQEWENDAASLWEDMSAALEERRPYLFDVEVPRSEVSGKTDRFVLFDSKRDYLSQMDAYNAWHDGDEAAQASQEDPG